MFKKKNFIKVSLIFFFISFLGNYVFSQNELKIIFNSYEKIRLYYEKTDFSLSKITTPKGDFVEFKIKNTGFSNEPGAPKLPAIKKLIEIPHNSTIKIKIIDYTTKEFELKELGINEKIKIIPAQPPISKSQKFEETEFVINEAIYSHNDYTENEIVKIEEIGELRGIKIARLEVYPIKYNPVKDRLKLYENIYFEIIFENADISHTIEKKRKYYSPYFEKTFSFLANYKPLNEKTNFTKYPIKYVIVSDPMFKSILQPFIEWKIKKGFKVIEAYTDDPIVGNNNVSIKNYLKNLYLNATTEDPAPSFILFVGDVEQIPPFQGTTGSHVTDLYYCEYTDDYLPDVFYGRFSARNATELIPQIEKTLEYEQYSMPDPSFLSTCVMISGVDANYAQVWGNGQINYGVNEYFNSNFGLTSHTYLYPSSANSEQQIIQNVSNGCGFVNYTAHGSPSGWSDPAFNISDIQNLNNTGKYPLMVGNCCLTNTFDNPECFGEALLRASGKGAIGYIGGSNSTYWDEDYYWGVGYRANIVEYPSYSPSELGCYDRLFHSHGEHFVEWFTTQGQMIFAGNLAVEQSNSNRKKYYWEVYHLMGDPSLSVYLGIPTELSVNYIPFIPIGVNSFTINTEPYSYVAISKDNVLHGAALADSNGIATINIIPFDNPTIANVVVTKQNKKPFFGELIAQSPEGPFIIYKSYTINDSNGNNNNQIDYGEDILLSISLKNVGFSEANGVQATLKCYSQYATITDSIHFYGTILSDEISTASDAFAVKISSYVPDQTTVTFYLTITDDSLNTWNYQFNVKINAPKFNILNIKINDTSGGNNNGRLDPGETAELLIYVKNIGHSDITSATCILTTSSQFITIHNNNYTINNLTSNGNTQTANFIITVDQNVQIGSYANFNFEISSNAYSSQKSFNEKIGIIVEDWENGNFNNFQWINNSYSPWFITDSIAYEGQYCSRSGVIFDNEESVLQLTLNVIYNDTISFYRKVSSEENYDELIFYINNVKKSSWSGEKDWQKVSFPVSQGIRTFKWIYKKDMSISEGFDCAWIDFIELPNNSFTEIQEKQIVNNKIKIYPNPTTSNITITINSNKNQDAKLILKNIHGKILNNYLINLQTGINTFTIKLDNYASGMYLIVFESNEQTITNKIIIQ